MNQKLSRVEQIKNLDNLTLKNEAKRLYDVVYNRPNHSVSDVEQFDTIRMELLSRGLKMKRINTIYFCDSC